MEQEKKSNLDKLLNCLLVILPSMLNIGLYLKYTFERELRAGIKNIMLLFMLCLVTVLLIFSSWICLLALLYHYLIMAGLTVTPALIILFCINIISLALTAKAILQIKINLPSLRQN